MTDKIAQIAMDRIQRDPQHLESWSVLFMLFAKADEQASLDRLIEFRQQRLSDGLGFFYQAMRDLLALGRDREADRVQRRIGPNNILYPVARYMAGLLACRQGRSDEAIQLIRQARSLLDHPVVKNVTAQDRLFQEIAAKHIAAQASFLQTKAEILGLPAEPAAPPPIDWRIAPAHLPDGPILAAAADRVYFARFAGDLVRSAAASNPGGLHLHLLNPDAATEAEADALAAQYPFLGISTEAGARNSRYYACSRFLIAPLLRARYGRKLVLTDIDILLTGSIAPVITALGDADLGWRELRDQLPVPSLICDARIVAIQDTPAAGLFLTLLARGLQPLLAANAPWMVDQAALYSVSRALSDQVRCVDLGPILGRDYAGILQPVDKGEPSGLAR